MKCNFDCAINSSGQRFYTRSRFVEAQLSRILSLSLSSRSQSSRRPNRTIFKRKNIDVYFSLSPEGTTYFRSRSFSGSCIFLLSFRVLCGISSYIIVEVVIWKRGLETLQATLLNIFILDFFYKFIMYKNLLNATIYILNNEPTIKYGNSGRCNLLQNYQ